MKQCLSDQVKQVNRKGWLGDVQIEEMQRKVHSKDDLCTEPTPETDTVDVDIINNISVISM